MNMKLHLLQTKLDYSLSQGMYSLAEYLEESIRLIKGKETKMEKTSTKVWNPTLRPTLQQAQDFVGGNVELITLTGDRQMLVNEEGLIEDLPINDEATHMASSANAHLLIHGGIRGDVIILQGATLWN